MKNFTPCQTALAAIKAAKGFKLWGRFMARAYIRNRKIPANVVRAARYCEALKNAGLI